MKNDSDDGQTGKVLQQFQSHTLTLFGVKLSCEQIALGDDRNKGLRAMHCSRGDDRFILWDDMVTVHEVHVITIRDTAQQRIVMHDFECVPAHVRNFELRFCLKSTNFAGNQPEPSILLGRADVYALTSDTEQMPAAVLEAMAMGLPVAATDVGDLRHMLPAANAPFLVPRDDEAALAAALGRLLEDETSRRRVGEANRARQAGCYDASTMIEAYGRYWRDLTR